jgi:hypothetical protein
MRTQKTALNNLTLRKAFNKSDLGSTDLKKVNLGAGGPTNTMISIGTWNKIVNI